MVLETKDAKAPVTKQGGASYFVTIMLTGAAVFIVLWWIPPLVLLVYAVVHSQWSVVMAFVAFFYWQLKQTASTAWAAKDTFLAAAVELSRLYLVPLCFIYLAVRSNNTRLLLSALYITLIFSLNRYAAGCKTVFHSGDQKLRILLAGDSFWPKVDGVATFTEHAIKQLVKNGHQVHVLTSRTSVPVLFGADVTRLPGVEPEMCPDHSASIPTLQCISTLRKFKPHAVHVFDPSVFSILMLVYC